MNYQSIAQTLGLKQPNPTPMDLVKIVRHGIPKKSITLLANCLNIPVPELTSHLHVSERTLQRYTPNKLLSSSLSDHILQIAKVYTRSLEVFESPEDAAAWLNQINIALGNTTPIELLDTSSGIEMILDELIRIEHGIFT